MSGKVGVETHAVPSMHDGKTKSIAALSAA
jgi:hypothetical protein